jgi:DNA-binding response OmpR family regulator
MKTLASGTGSSVALGSSPEHRLPERVLLLEDETLVRLMLGYHLERAGYRVLEATSGQEAAQHLEDHADSIVLLLVDLGIPGISSKDVVSAALIRQPDIKVLYMSGSPADRFAPQELPPGSWFIQKPFTEQKLLSTIRRLIARPVAK